jgi:acid stress-induced BolA-like protein IbaG/YrbA
MLQDASRSTTDAIKASVEACIPEAGVEVTSSGGGHYSLVVRSALFRSHTMLECHRMVYAAIAPLMSGSEAPVHAIDTLKTIAR